MTDYRHSVGHKRFRNDNRDMKPHDDGLPRTWTTPPRSAEAADARASAPPLTTSPPRDRVRVALDRRWQRRTAERLTTAVGILAVHSLVNGEWCDDLARAAAIFDQAELLTVTVVERSVADATEPAEIFVRRVVASVARRAAGTACPRQVAGMLRTAAVWRCALRGRAARCPCIMDTRRPQDRMTLMD